MFSFSMGVGLGDGRLFPLLLDKERLHMKDLRSTFSDTKIFKHDSWNVKSSIKAQINQ